MRALERPRYEVYYKFEAVPLQFISDLSSICVPIATKIQFWDMIFSAVVMQRQKTFQSCLTSRDRCDLAVFIGRLERQKGLGHFAQHNFNVQEKKIGPPSFSTMALKEDLNRKSVFLHFPEDFVKSIYGWREIETEECHGLQCGMIGFTRFFPICPE